VHAVAAKGIFENYVASCDIGCTVALSVVYLTIVSTKLHLTETSQN